MSAPGSDLDAVEAWNKPDLRRVEHGDPFVFYGIERFEFLEVIAGVHLFPYFIGLCIVLEDTREARTLIPDSR